MLPTRHFRHPGYSAMREAAPCALSMLVVAMRALRKQVAAGIKMFRPGQPLGSQQRFQGFLKAIIVGSGTGVALPDRGDQAGLKLAPLIATTLAQCPGHAEHTPLPGFLESQFAIDHGRRQRAFKRKFVGLIQRHHSHQAPSLPDQPVEPTPKVDGRCAASIHSHPAASLQARASKMCIEDAFRTQTPIPAGIPVARPTVPNLAIQKGTPTVPHPQTMLQPAQ